AEQVGPWIRLTVEVDPDASRNRVLMQGNYYNSGRMLGGLIDIVHGVAVYDDPMFDPCTEIPTGLDYVTVHLNGDPSNSASAAFPLCGHLVNDVTEIPEVGDGGDEYVVLCDGSGDFPYPWTFKVLFPGGTFELNGYGTLVNGSSQVVLPSAVTGEDAL